MVYTLFWQVPVIGTWQVATHSPPISTLNSKPDGPADVASSRILQPHSLPAQIQNDPLIAIILILALATFCYFTNIISHSAGQSWSEKSTELKAGAGGIAPLSSYLINVSLYGASAAWATHDWICGPDSSWEAATEIPCIVPCRSARIALNSLYPRVHFLYIYTYQHWEKQLQQAHDETRFWFGGVNLMVVPTWWLGPSFGKLSILWDKYTSRDLNNHNGKQREKIPFVHAWKTGRCMIFSAKRLLELKHGVVHNYKRKKGSEKEMN